MKLLSDTSAAIIELAERWFGDCYNPRIRRFAVGTALLVVALVTGSLAQSDPFRAGDSLPAWTPGTLDIHQIVTGRGNAAFMMFPDGTTLLLDAGDAGGHGI